ncbi:hypothetical protein NFI96_005105, partial [Prochilodus magdalenae]
MELLPTADEAMKRANSSDISVRRPIMALLQVLKEKSEEATQLLFQSLVISRLDYCNSLLAGLPLRAIRPLQLVQNAAARLIFNLPKFTHVTPLLRSLQWLPVIARIRFKTLMLAYKAKNGPAPPYLMAIVNLRASSRRIRPFLSQEATQLLFQSLVISRLDYRNSLLAGLPLRAIRPLQLVQNAAARLIFNLPRFTHVTPLLRSLQWLPVIARIRFKTLMLAYKAKNGPAPPYLMAIVNLRASSTAPLEPPSLRTHGRQASRLFSVLAPRCLMEVSDGEEREGEKEGRRIRPFLSQEATQLLFQSLVISRLDYCNSLLAGLPLQAIRPLQLVQNAAARLIFNLPKFTHVTPLLRSLQWLPVIAHIRFKTLMLAYKAKNGPAPPYLMAIVNLRASSTARLEPPSLRTHGRQASRLFSVLAPRCLMEVSDGEEREGEKE